jgi:hypothetical protein
MAVGEVETRSRELLLDSDYRCEGILAADSRGTCQRSRVFRAARGGKAQGMTEQEIRAMKKEARELRKCLENLTMTVRQFIHLLDSEMKNPSDVARGRRIAKLQNSLEWVNDHARFLTLREDLIKPKKMKPIVE